MAVKSFIADRKTQDIIKQDTTDILTTMENGLGTDWSKYTPIRSASNKILNSAGDTSLYQVLGAGFISRLVFFSLDGAITRMVVKIDGIVVANLISNSSRVSALGFDSTIKNNPIDNEFSIFCLGTWRKIPSYSAFITSIQPNSFYPLQSPIFFNESLEILVNRPSAAQTVVDFDISGGLAL